MPLLASNVCFSYRSLRHTAFLLSRFTGFRTLRLSSVNMSFACQRDSYLKELTSRVKSCEAVNGSFEIILDDTVLFPEGGGQPFDTGKIGDVAVKSVLRRGGTAVHIANEEVAVGASLLCKIDWERRYDHMQQHSAQHLLSALLDSRYGYATTSWDLGKTVSHVELNTPNLTQDQINVIEKECNAQIRNHTKVVTHFLSKEEAMGLEEVKTRGLPDDHVGEVRVIEIEGVDKNMCCGTHLANLSDLQTIKFLHTETMRGGTRLFFIAGDRVLKKLGASLENERSLTKLLSCGPDDHVEAVDKLAKSIRTVQKTCKMQLRELAKLEAQQQLKGIDGHGLLFHHRDDGDMDYINIFLNEVKSKSKDLLVWVSVGEVKTGGQFVITGSEPKVDQIGPKASELTNGKGGGKKGRFQGKAANFGRLKEIRQLMTELSL